jgi:hypothetical protein
LVPARLRQNASFEAARRQIRTPRSRPLPARSLYGTAQRRFQAAEIALAALAGTPDEARYNRAGTRHDRALVRLLTTPAPHAAALADKLDLLIVHLAWELRAGDACLAAIRVDARRFAC